MSAVFTGTVTKIFEAQESRHLGGAGKDVIVNLEGTGRFYATINGHFSILVSEDRPPDFVVGDTVRITVEKGA